MCDYISLKKWLQWKENWSFYIKFHEYMYKSSIVDVGVNCEYVEAVQSSDWQQAVKSTFLSENISLSLLVVIIKVITFFIMFNAIYLVRIIAWELISEFFIHAWWATEWNILCFSRIHVMLCNKKSSHDKFKKIVHVYAIYCSIWVWMWQKLTILLISYNK